MRLIPILASCLCAPLIGFAEPTASDSFPSQIHPSVTKLDVIGGNGGLIQGSAVVIAPDTLVTNCHVTQRARDIQVVHEGRRWSAQPGAEDLARDVCLLHVADLDLPAAALGSSTGLADGSTVYAAGYPQGCAGKVSQGEIVARHDHDDAHVLQTNARFTSGQSGGGLFDADGRLVGILTFKAPAGGALHFAVPVDWAIELMINTEPPANNVAARYSKKPFWSLPTHLQPTYLRTASHQRYQQTLRTAKSAPIR